MSPSLVTNFLGILIILVFTWPHPCVQGLISVFHTDSLLLYYSRYVSAGSYVANLHVFLAQHCKGVTPFNLKCNHFDSIFHKIANWFQNDFYTCKNLAATTCHHAKPEISSMLHRQKCQFFEVFAFMSKKWAGTIFPELELLHEPAIVNSLTIDQNMYSHQPHNI